MQKLNESAKSNNLENLDPKYAGVEGFLLFVCFYLIILQTIGNLILLFSNYNNIINMSRYRDLHTIAFIDSALYLIYIFSGIYAGISLLLIKKNATKKAKAFLIFGILYAIISPIVLVVGGDLDFNFTIFIRSLIPQIIWYNLGASYLKNSKRIKNTYHPNHFNLVKEKLVNKMNKWFNIPKETLISLIKDESIISQ
ncbi:MAG: DUF2569 family protein [Candidatus Hodarchaeota archaeon]